MQAKQLGDTPQESSFQKLQKRAFGGEDVATRPGVEDDEWWPKGPLLPGIRELTEDFISSTEAPDSLHLVFLLGGAGNGKSFVARSLGAKLGISVSSNDTLAHRIYKTTRNGVCIELLNDATIAARAEYDVHQSVALACDVQRWWDASASRPVAAFCCVNRGIIIDELHSLSESSSDVEDFARTVLEWLASPEFDVAKQLGGVPEGAKCDFGDHYRECRFRLDGRFVRLSAISVDSSSLLAKGSGYSRAGALFQQIVERCRDDAMARPEDCPIRANLQQWMSSSAIQNWEKVLAYAEISSGRLHSYRDVWGIAALSILGPKYATTDGSNSLLEYMDRCLHRARHGNSLQERLGALLEMSQFRVHNALFRAPIPTSTEKAVSEPPTTPAYFGLSLVDPSRWGGGHSQAVEEAMQGISLGETPSEMLVSSGLLDDAWFEFDRRLEQAIVEYVCHEDCPDNVRRRLISWFGGYLTRLVGVSKGELGNREVVEKWEECRDKCAAGVGKLPLPFEDAVRSLLFPQDQHGSVPRGHILVPAFAARIEPLRLLREGARSKLIEVIPHNSITLQVRRQGSRLVLECGLTGRDEVIGQLILDFSLVREALACHGHRAGRTESTAYVEPRIERCRASSLGAVPGDQRRLAVVCGGTLVWS